MIPQLLSKTSAADLNNGAITYLQDGHPEEALELLQLALASLRDHFQDESEGSTQPDNRRARLRPAVPQQQEPSMQVDDDDDDEVFLKDSVNVFSAMPFTIEQEASALILYNRALMIDTNSSLANASEIISSVVLFNMGLLHHTWGIGHGKSDLLERANRLYEIALDVLDKQPNDSALLRMAILNNIAHIGSQLFRPDSMRNSLLELRDLVEMDDTPLEEEDYVIFFMNSMVGQKNEFTLAPAA